MPKFHFAGPHSRTLLASTRGQNPRRHVGRALSREQHRLCVADDSAHLWAAELLADDALRETFEKNVYGPVCVLRTLLPAIRASRAGIVAWIAGRVAGRPIF